VPSGVTAGSAFSLVTQPDPTNNNATYNVRYALGTVNGDAAESVGAPLALGFPEV